MSQAKRVNRRADGKQSATKVRLMRVERRTAVENLANEVADVYLHVMEEVIQSVREDFVKEGVDENVLMKLRQLWESNLRHSRVANRAGTQEGQSAITRVGNPSTHLCDLNVPYGAPDEYQSFLNTGEPSKFNCNPPGPNDSTDAAAERVKLDIQRGEVLSCMPQPDPWITQKQLAVDVNGDVHEISEEVQLNGDAGHRQALVAKDFLNLSSGKRNREELTTGSIFPSNYSPQLEGVEDIPARLDCSQDSPVCLLGGPEEISFRSFNSELRSLRKSDADTQVEPLPEAFPRENCIPQYDGVYDYPYNGVLCEDYNEPGDDESHMEDSGAIGVLYVNPAPWESGVSNKESVTPEKRDLDRGEASDEEDQTFIFDDNDAVESPQAAFKADHSILAKVVIVKRTKSKWKCTLKHGIMNLNNEDYLFLEASGKFEF